MNTLFYALVHSSIHTPIQPIICSFIYPYISPLTHPPTHHPFFICPSSNTCTLYPHKHPLTVRSSTSLSTDPPSQPATQWCTHSHINQLIYWLMQHLPRYLLPLYLYPFTHPLINQTTLQSIYPLSIYPLIHPPTHYSLTHPHLHHSFRPPADTLIYSSNRLSLHLWICHWTQSTPYPLTHTVILLPTTIHLPIVITTCPPTHLFIYPLVHPSAMHIFHHSVPAYAFSKEGVGWDPGTKMENILFIKDKCILCCIPNPMKL